MGFDENFATIWNIPGHSRTFFDIREFSAFLIKRLRETASQLPCMVTCIFEESSAAWKVSALKVPQFRPSWECKQEADDLKFCEAFEFKLPNRRHSRRGVWFECSIACGRAIWCVKVYGIEAVVEFALGIQRRHLSCWQAAGARASLISSEFSVDFEKAFCEVGPVDREEKSVRLTVKHSPIWFEFLVTPGKSAHSLAVKRYFKLFLGLKNY